MRFVRIIPFLLLAAAACGDDNSNTRRDAAPGRDSAPDDGDVEDAPPDGPPSGGARVWVLGDFGTDNRRTAGSFLTDATLPFNTTTPPPVVIPAGSAEIFDGTGSTQQVFHTNGTKIAYVADATVPLRFDLFVANADGSNPVMVVQGPGLTQEITGVTLSPDGTKVAYTMDSVLLDNGYDLYVAPTTAAATGVKVSPDRTATVPTADQDVFSVVNWSADSKFLAFSADLAENGVDQAYVTDTSVATPTTAIILARTDITATAGTRGVRGGIVFDAQNNVYFRARVDDANTLFKLFKSSPTDGTTKTVVTMPLRGDNSTPDVGAFGITPDGTKLVYSADAPTAAAYDMYVAPVATPNTSTKITNLTAAGNANFNTPLAFSFDNTKVAVIANFQSATNAEPFVIALDGSATRRLAAVTCTNCDTTNLQWDPDNATVWALGDLLVNNDGQAYKLNSATMDQTPTLAVDVVAGGDIINLFVRP